VSVPLYFVAERQDEVYNYIVSWQYSNAWLWFVIMLFAGSIQMLGCGL